MSKRILLSWSGGKDSAWALYRLQTDPRWAGYEVGGLLTTVNRHFQRVAIHGYREILLDQQGEAAGLPLWKVDLPWPCSNQAYEAAMSPALQHAADQGVHGIAFGDLFLEDIRRFREQSLAPFGLQALFPLWREPTGALALQMVASGLEAYLTCVDPRLVDAGFAGRLFDEVLIAQLPIEVDPCGERGEFHSFACAGPMFRRSIGVRPGETVFRDGFVYADLLPVGAAGESSADEREASLGRE